MTYEVRNVNLKSRPNSSKVHWGPLLFKTTLLESHFYDLLRDTSTVHNEKLDFRKFLAGKLSLEYEFNDTLRQSWSNKLKKYLVEYFECLKEHNSISDHNAADYFSNVGHSLEKLELEKMWANFQKKLEYNPLHNHSGFLSFVAYMDVPEALRTEEKVDTSNLHAGDIEFVNALANAQFKVSPQPRNLNHFLTSMLMPINAKICSPVNGDLLIFPSYLHHQVSSFKTDVTRVSVSGNWSLL